MDAVRDPTLVRLRELTTATPDDSVTEDQVHIEVELEDGRTLTHFVEESLGNVHRPLSNEQLDEKFRDQSVLALPADVVEEVLSTCWKIDELEDAGELARLTRPAQA